MNQTLNFATLKRAWDQVKVNRAPDLKKLATGLVNPNAIRIKLIQEDPNYITVEFFGFADAAEDQSHAVPQIKRAIVTWLRRFRTDVQQMREAGELIVRVRTNLRFSEAEEPRKMNPPDFHMPKYEHTNRELTRLIRIVRN